MENYSRTAMLVSFSEYQKKVAEKQKSDKDLELNPDKFKGIKPGAIIGQMYPDLCSQAAYINKDIEKLKSDMADTIKELFFEVGEEAVIMAIDYMSDYLTNSFQDLDEDDNSFSRKTLLSVQGDVYARGIIAKKLLNLYLDNNQLKKLKERRELTEKNILL